jgi:C4-type Zn-finger protein
MSSDSPFAREYDRATCTMLEGVFESAWEQLESRHFLAAQPPNAHAAREELASRIAEAYQEGERDPETIEFVALKAFDRWLKPE